MNLGLQILIGVVIGFVFGIFTITSNINKQENEVLKAYEKLAEALHIRYLKLKNILGFLKKHMHDFHNEIGELDRALDGALNVGNKIKDINLAIEHENIINYKLEEIKRNMENYPSLQEDPEIDNSIIAIAESEVYVGEAIEMYNSTNSSYKTFLSTFPITIGASILDKKPDTPNFIVSTVEEFGNDYVFEDDIN